ncbi:MAG: transglutaminase-like domain-containing protein [Kiritimatiellae bacterium]|nr:transglutaminase-like domain-containing protein [Kiritimatiellia bacterium]
MKRKTAVILILLFWLLLFTWFIRFEAFPHLFSKSVRLDYRELLNDAPLMSDAWMKIIMQGVHVGYSHTAMEVDEKNPVDRFILRNTTDLDLNMLGTIQPVLIRVHSTLDAFYALQYFEFSMKTGKYAISLNARRIEKDTFRVNMRSAGGNQTLFIELPPDIIIYSPVIDMALRQLKPGQSVTMNTLDPATLRPMKNLITALRYETIPWHGTNLETTVFSYTYSGSEMLTWMDTRDGQVLRQETPWGWSLEAASPTEAVRVDRRRAAQLDLTTALAVPAQPPLNSPRSITSLVVRLEGAGIAALDLASHRQRLTQRSSNALVMTVSSDRLPQLPTDTIPENIQIELQPTIYIQCDDPAIQRMAQKITDGITSRSEQVAALTDWVFSNVRKDPSITLPSALDVLQSMRGDCNEHTYLFVALARAAGIPARVQVGFMYTQGAFYYHAWPAVYLDGWVETDPTLGTLGVDATHIALLHGELPEQVKLLNIIGQTRAVILEQHHDPNHKAE